MTVISPTRKSATASLLRGQVSVSKLNSTRRNKTHHNETKRNKTKQPIRWLTLALDTMLEEEQLLWNPPQRYFRGSNASEVCTRAMTLKALGHNTPVPARVTRIFATGNMIEKVNVEAARRAGLLVEGSQQRDASYGGALRIIRNLIPDLPIAQEREIRQHFAVHDPVLDVWFAGEGKASELGTKFVVFEDDISQRWWKFFEFSGLRFKPDKKSSDPPIFGHIDLIVVHPEDGVEYLCDVKSIRQEMYRNLPPEHDVMLAGESPLMKRHSKYVEQLNGYMWAPTIDLEVGCLLFEAKNDQEQKVYWLRRDPKMQAEMLKRHRAAAFYIQMTSQEVAPIPEERNPERGDETCVACNQRSICRRLAGKYGKAAVDYTTLRKVDAEIRG